MGTRSDNMEIRHCLESVNSHGLLLRMCRQHFWRRSPYQLVFHVDSIQFNCLVLPAQRNLARELFRRSFSNYLIEKS
jgi:hypothetical protein